jgi:hypothetical protein
MYNIIINDSIETLGLITFRISKDANDNLIREGYLKTHLYIEEIASLECSRFRLEGIDVYPNHLDQLIYLIYINLHMKNI